MEDVRLEVGDTLKCADYLDALNARVQLRREGIRVKQDGTVLTVIEVEARK